MFETIKKLNPQIDLKPVISNDFKKYGYVTKNECIDEVVEYLNDNTPIEDGVKYTASDKEAEAISSYERIKREYFGEMNIQIGWCNGKNDKLNALEYHSGNELNIAATDAILLLASLWEVENGELSTDKVRGFYMEKGQGVMLYSSTLHFAPCSVFDSGFRVGIVLPAGTNTPLDKKSVDEPSLWMKNKWLLAHKEASHLVDAGAYVGLVGDFITLKRV